MKRLTALFLSLLLTLSLTACDVTLPSGETVQPSDIIQTIAPVEGVLEVHFIDVGQADAALLLCDGDAMLIDGGNVADSDLIVAYLAAMGVEELEVVVCTHGHEDHVGGLAGALSQYPTDVVYCPVTEYDSTAFSNFLKYTEAQGNSITIPDPGDQWMLGDAYVTVLGPLEDYSDANDTSIVLRVDFGETSFLFTGDAEEPAETDMLEAGMYLEADVLKVGHHGSSTSTTQAFLGEVNPSYAVISCGQDNSYGHPHDEVMERLAAAEIEVYRTDSQGHIVATSDGETVTFEVGRNADIDTNPTVTTDSGSQTAEDYYIGNLNSQIFHCPDCSSLPAEHNQIIFDTREEAVEAGYTSCGRCQP